MPTASYNAFDLQVLDDADANIYRYVNTLTIYARGAIKYETALGEAFGYIPVKYMDMGNGVQYEYQWEKDGRIFVYNDSIAQRLMTIEEIETFINSIAVEIGSMPVWLTIENTDIGVQSILFSDSMKTEATLMTNTSDLIEVDCVDLKLKYGQERTRAVINITNTEQVGTGDLGLTAKGYNITYEIVENHPITGDAGYKYYYVAHGKYVSIALENFEDMSIIEDLVDSIDIFCY